MPERIDAAAVLAVHAVDVPPAQYFVTQGRTDDASEGVGASGNDGNLSAPEAGKLPRLRVVSAPGALIFEFLRQLGQLRHAL